MTLGQQKSLVISQLGKFLDPGKILFLLRHRPLDKDGLLVLVVLDNLPVAKNLVGYFRELLIVSFGDRFLLVRSHYLSKIISINKIKFHLPSI